MNPNISQEKNMTCPFLPRPCLPIPSHPRAQIADLKKKKKKWPTNAAVRRQERKAEDRWATQVAGYIHVCNIGDLGLFFFF